MPITPSMKLLYRRRRAPSVPAGHLRTVPGTPSEVDLRRLSSIALNSRRWLAGGKHLPITFPAAPAPSQRLSAAFCIRGDASRQVHERQNSGRRHADTKSLPSTFRAPGSTFLIAVAAEGGYASR